jgi:hypothetical protein
MKKTSSLETCLFYQQGKEVPVPRQIKLGGFVNTVQPFSQLVQPLLLFHLRTQKEGVKHERQKRHRYE